MEDDSPEPGPSWRDRGNNMRSDRHNEGIRFIGFRTLQEMAQAEEKEVLEKVNERREAFINIVNSPNKDNLDYYVLLIEILSKISQSPFVELKSKLILDVCNSEFINNLQKYLTHLPYTDNWSSNSLYWYNQNEFWKNFITFCGYIVDTFPSIALKTLRALIDSVTKACLNCLNDEYNFVLSEENVLKLDEIRQKMASYDDKCQQPEGKPMQQPTENFRELSVVPSKEDLLESTPFLRPNIGEGGYNDVDHFLDAQSKQLREDCFGPFRDGLRSSRRDRGNNMRSGRENERIRFIGFRTLQEIAQAEEKEVLQKVNEKREAFMNVVNSPNKDNLDYYVLLIGILSKISQSPFVELKSKLILDVCNSEFINNLRNYLMDLPYTDKRSSNCLYWNDQNEFWKNFIIFCGDIVDTSPSIALKRCRALIDSVTKTCLNCLNDEHNFVLSEVNVLKLDEIRQKMASHVDKYQQPEGNRITVANQDPQMQQPPENFRELSVVPTKEDLLGSTPFLRPNIVEGGYNDVEHYLDVQFRLLREDCFGPLRDGLDQYLRDPNKKEYDHIRVFHNVRFLCPYVDNLKVGAIAQIDMKTNKNFHKIYWANNKRFIFGSLVLFTKDHCTSFMAATILDRDANLLSTGKIPVSVIDEDLDNSIFNKKDTYTMIESEIYFEPYYHVLKALQETSFPRHLAMQQYIVKVDAASKHPAYLSPDTEFFIYKRPKTLKFKVLQPETWPTADELGFNESQYEAYRLALTHEFAVIQGPPGTGKTFISIKVATTLLQNIKSKGHCLMLVICYTNHALDQFLEAISQITQSIVRIGGQSRNEAMDEFNLTNLRRESLLTPCLNSTHSFFKDEKNQLINSIWALEQALSTLNVLNNGVLRYRFLDDRDRQHLEYYYRNKGIRVNDPLEHWLFEAVLGGNSEYERNISDILLEYGVLANNEEDINEDRAEMILDDDDQSFFFNFIEYQASFLLSKAKAELRKLCREIGYLFVNEKKLQIQELDARINLFNDMVTHRHREVQLQIHHDTDFSLITVQNRWCLYFMWIRNQINKVKTEIALLQGEVAPAQAAYEEARMMMDVQLLRNKRVKVVGMTTSGAARMRKLLQAIAPKIVIVEEAAEVLEQHIITSLTQDCQHFILIGDHQQLRPSASHIKLARRYNIEVSLFERMITNGIHSRRLNVQHRMRPEIAALISPHIYPDLANHPSVEAFNNVPGIEKNLYFFTHDYREETQDESKTKANHKEADMALALANYLMQQGYTAYDITILAAYAGQMFYMIKKRHQYARLSDVKITVVDNYQGEESKIIILSLVRNNEENNIGFLGIDNRVCVALSRAKEGFYIFGNINMLKLAKSDLWSKIATTLEKNGSLGTTLILKCQNHPDRITTISTLNDFNKLPPEGGCFEKCNYQYQCGHKCQLYCHVYDREHYTTKCTMECERVLCELGHVCPLECWEDCDPCMVLVVKTLPCGHEENIYCYRDPEDQQNTCLTKVDVILPNCEHEAQKYCYQDIKNVKCLVPCEYRLEECGHVCRRECHVTDDPNHKNYSCFEPCARAKAGCKAELIGDRGDHQCRKTCNEKCDDCNVQVKKKRSNCKHSETVACSKSVDDIPCNKNCTRTMTCGHFCKKKCCEPCGDCTQMVDKVILECLHTIKVQCKQSVSQELCNEKCKRLLSCGHPCMDRCGSECDPTKCTKPSSDEVLSPCGHKVTLPCNVSALFAKGEVKPEQLLQYCARACGATLACGHVCAGTCARCLQGRLHQPCTQTCNQDNICGHQCQEPCNQICPPCKMLCEVQCPHSHCKKLCGEPCTPCQAKCSRRCKHGQCTRRCSEECSRAPCDARCGRRLACGHMCRGLCGEPCPPVCQLCRPDEFPTDFLGDAYEEHDKFIVLQDCGHVLELDTMDTLMLGNQENIKIPTCPFCRKAIINTNRYKDTVNRMFKNDINPIKVQVYGTDKQIQMKMTELRRKVDRFSEENEKYMEDYKDMKVTFLGFTTLLKTQQKVSLLQVKMECVYLNIFEMIVKCWQKYQTQTPQITTLKDELQKHIKTLLDVLKIRPKSKIPIKISEQQQKDIGNEIKRLNVIVQLSTLLHLAISMKDELKVTEQVKTTKAVVYSISVFNEDNALESLKQLQAAIKSSSVVAKYEHALVVKAIGLKAGHWYKCPNGHIYYIGECGGKVEKRLCPECGARIGGRNHALTAGNRHAPEMDGSRHVATSEQNNMANFNVDGIL